MKIVQILLSLILLFSVGCEESKEETMGTISDIDGNSYKTVKIGDQWWMAENLKVTHYRDGTTIPNVPDNDQWTNLSTDALIAYNNDSSNESDTYGYLYNGYAMNGDINGDGIKDKEIAPEGWHVPTIEEWEELVNYLGGENVAGKMLKSKNGWINDGNGNDSLDFCAVPGGNRSRGDGYFYGKGNFAYFWSAPRGNALEASYHSLSDGQDSFYRYGSGLQSGFSVRLVKGDNTTPYASFRAVPELGTTETVFYFDASGSSDIEDQIGQLQFRWDFESDGSWDIDWSSNMSTNHKYIDVGIYTITMEVRDSKGYSVTTTTVITVNEFTLKYGTVTDIDGNIYKTVEIGDQWWMAENLKTTKYRDGIAISNATDNSIWAGLSSGAYCYYDNDSGNAEIYGAMYNWYAVNDSRNIAPEGWHVPTNEEWQELLDSLGGYLVAGKKLKSTSAWIYDRNGIDTVGFCAFPGGYRSYTGNSSYMSAGAYFWTASEYSSDYGWIYKLSYDRNSINSDVYLKTLGYSVRCIQD
ncbi:hypothetical protein KAJ27_10955 [bacterium]|nr:hypothetical protein [bacterium]